MSNDKNIRNAHPTHAEYNKRFDPPASPSSVKLDGPWMKAETLRNLPIIRLAFNRSRVPPAPEQENDPSRDHSGETQTGRVDKSKPELKPPPHQRGRVDRVESLRAERDAALARAAKAEPESNDQSPQHIPIFTGPSM